MLQFLHISVKGSEISITDKLLQDGDSDTCARRVAGNCKNSHFRGRTQRDGGGDEAYQRAETGVGHEPCQDEGNVSRLASCTEYARLGQDWQFCSITKHEQPFRTTNVIYWLP